MKKPTLSVKAGSIALLMGWALILMRSEHAMAQSCPSSGTTFLNTYPNTFFPGTQASLPAGSTSITIGAASYGSTGISSGDIIFIIQMQGAQINSTNTSAYGDGSGVG